MLKRLRNQRGAALLETAITLPLVLLVTVSIFEFGRAYQTWQVLTNAAREGARVAVIAGHTDTQVTDAVRSYMQNGQLPMHASASVSVNRNVPFGSHVGLDGHGELSISVHRAQSRHAARVAEFDDGPGHDEHGRLRIDAERVSTSP